MISVSDRRWPLQGSAEGREAKGGERRRRRSNRRSKGVVLGRPLMNMGRRRRRWQRMARWLDDGFGREMKLKVGVFLSVLQKK